MKKHLFIILLLVYSINVRATIQNEGILNVAGAVIVGDRPIAGAEIIVYRGNEIVERHVTSRRGTFSIDLPLNQQNVVSFSSTGMITKSILFNTQVPQQVGAGELFYFEFILDLFADVPWVDKTIFESPIITISFDGQTEEFTYQRDEHRAIRAQLDAINEVRERIYRFNRQHRELLDLSEASYKRGDYNTAHTQLSQLIASHSRDTFLLRRLNIVELAMERQKREQAEEIARAQAPIINEIAATTPVKVDPIPVQAPITPEPVRPRPPVVAVTPEPVAPRPPVVAVAPEPVQAPITPQPVAPRPPVVAVTPEPVAPRTPTADAGATRPAAIQRNVPVEPAIPRNVAETQAATGAITFHSALAPYQRLDVQENVIFMVQVLATSGKPRANFFAPIVENMPGHEVVHYRDLDGLNKYGVGLYHEFYQAMETVRTLRNLGYDTFIVAFANGRRVRVSEAKAQTGL